MAESQHFRPERRRQWRDRRSGSDRRNPTRHAHDGYDCRSGDARRDGDIAVEFDDSDTARNGNDAATIAPDRFL